jgi:hypothetical protein
MASEPECAFKSEQFDSSNWQCATMNALRGLVEEPAVYNDDQWAAVIPVSGTGAFIVLGWYKERGRTEQAYVMHAATDARREEKRLITPLTLEIAEKALGRK